MLLTPARDPVKHPALTARQGFPIGRSLRPESPSRVSLDQLLACIHCGPELRLEPCPTCSAGTRIKIFACAIHSECQLSDTPSVARFCGDCLDLMGPK